MDAATPKSVILIGAGISIRDGIEKDLWQKIKGKEIWSLNFAYKTMPYLPTRELWVDTNFFKAYVDELQRLYFHGVKCCAKVHIKYQKIPEITTFITTRLTNEYHEKVYISGGGFVGFFALSLACKLDYDIIYLLGYDFGVANKYDKNGNINKDTHYYQNKIPVLSTGVGHPELYLNNDGTLKDRVKNYEIYTKEKVKIYNVSPKSNISCFEKVNYDKFFNMV